jgi:hypothetical protein
MIKTVVDLLNMVLRAGQGTLFEQEMEGVVIGLHCRPLPRQRWVVHQSKLQYLYSFAPCDLEIDGDFSQWFALITDRPLARGGCQIRGESAYLKALQSALERQKTLTEKNLRQGLPASLRSIADSLLTTLKNNRPTPPWLQKNDFEEAQKILRQCFDIINRVERDFALVQRESEQ